MKGSTKLPDWNPDKDKLYKLLSKPKAIKEDYWGHLKKLGFVKGLLEPVYKDGFGYEYLDIGSECLVLTVDMTETKHGVGEELCIYVTRDGVYFELKGKDYLINSSLFSTDAHEDVEWLVDILDHIKKEVYNVYTVERVLGKKIE